MLNVNVGGFASAHVFYNLDVERPVDGSDYGFRVLMARLSGKGERPGLGSAFVQLEAAFGQVQLLDVIGTLDAIPQVRIRTGYFRTPFSFEMQTGLGAVPFVNRSLLVQRGLVPIRRLGADVQWTPLGKGLRFVGGVFHSFDGADLLNTTLLSLRDGTSEDILTGDLVMGAEFDLPDVVTIHAMVLARATGNLLAANTLGANAAANVGIRVPILGGNIDFEGMVGADEEGLLQSGVYISGARSFDTPWAVAGRTVALIPMLRVDAARTTVTEVRGTAGVAMAFAGDAFRVAFNQDVGLRDDNPTATTYFEIQAGF